MSRRDPITLTIFATHPIQYQVPWFRALNAEPGLDVQVFYAMLPDPSQQGVGFGVDFQWDLPLLDGYPWKLLENRAALPSLESFRGCDVRNIAAELRQARTDVALIAGWNSLYLLQALWASKILRIPILVRGESNLLKPRNFLKKRILKQLLKQFDRYLSIGRNNKEFYRALGVNNERVFSCPYFVDNERFTHQADDLGSQRSAFRGQWGISDEAVCFLFVGKLVPKKRVMDFLRAVDEARRLNPAVCGLVVGTGEQMGEARAYVESRRVPTRFAGFLNQKEVAAAYVAADCLVLPSDHGETWGLVVNEAMVCGLPAIVSDEVGCGPDLVVEGETGAVFPVGDIAALTGLMTGFALDRKSLKVMGKAAHDSVVDRYSLPRAVDGVKAAVDSLTARQVST